MTGHLVTAGIGNTTVKVGLVKSCGPSSWPEWLARREVPTANFDPATLSEMLPEQAVEWYIGSVQRTVESRLRDWVRLHRQQDHYRLLTFEDLPLKIQVEVPARVGLDRLAAAVAVNRLRDPARPAIVIDAGTAITVNLITPDGVFQGGVILPGLGLTARALSMGTDLLPLVAAEVYSEPPPVVGKSTEAAIRSGLFWGNVGAVREIVDRVHGELAQTPQVFVTGGDAQRLVDFIAPDAKFAPDLVLAGIFFSVSQSSKHP